jgi:hypothetical protein
MLVPPKIKQPQKARFTSLPQRLLWGEFKPPGKAENVFIADLQSA